MLMTTGSSLIQTNQIQKKAHLHEHEILNLRSFVTIYFLFHRSKLILKGLMCHKRKEEWAKQAAK